MTEPLDLRLKDSEVNIVPVTLGTRCDNELLTRLLVPTAPKSIIMLRMSVKQDSHVPG